MEEYCSGAILFTRIGGILHYVIVAELDGHFGLPKGHVEPGEDARTAALREVMEETGICPRLVEEFCMQTEYLSLSGGIKYTTVFLGEFDAQQEIRYNCEELSGAELLPFDQAYAKIKHRQVKEALKEADCFLQRLQ